MQDNRRLVTAGLAVLVGILGLLITVFTSLASDRQNVAVAIESLAISQKQQKTDIGEIKTTLKILADTNAQILVLQHQVADLQRRVDKVEMD